MRLLLKSLQNVILELKIYLKILPIFSSMEKMGRLFNGGACLKIGIREGRLVQGRLLFEVGRLFKEIPLFIYPTFGYPNF